MTSRYVHEVRDGVCTRAEIFGSDDEAGALRALCRLVGGDPVDRTTSLVLRTAETFNARAWDVMAGLEAPDLTISDHRRVVGHGFTGAEGIVDRAKSVVAVSSDARTSIDSLAEIDGIVMARQRHSGTMDDGGCPVEVQLRAVVTSRDGRITRWEFFDEDDETGMLAAVARLRRSPSCEPAATVVERVRECVNARDWAGLRDVYAEDFVSVDQRRVSVFGRLSRDEAFAVTRQLVASSEDVRLEFEQIGALGDVCLVRGTFFGNLDESGGAFETPSRYVVQTREGLIARVETFDADDEAGSLRALCRLVGGGDGTTGPATPVVLGLADALVARDWERVQGCFALDLVTADHRGVTALCFDHPGGAGFVERSRGLTGVAGDARPVVRMLAEIDGVAMAIVSWTGHLEDGGGEFELVWRGLIAVRDGVIARYELFDEDDEAGMLAAVARLRADG